MQDYEQLYKDFVASSKSLLIAPAGYGKTHTIGECLKYTTGHQLILTHTHAGVASIKEKVKKANPSCKYTIETISSFAQKYVEAFYCKKDKPEQDSKDYFPFIIDKAIKLFLLKPIADIIRATYSGLFVDEYQDCTISQHQMIISLSEHLSLHVLGNPLQGIFDFNDEQLVDFSKAFIGFDSLELKEPWRWKNINAPLGDNLKDIRDKLIANQSINLKDYTAITNHIVQEDDLYNPQSSYFTDISHLLNKNSSLLLLHPGSENKHSRIKLIKQFKNRFRMVEAMDSKEFYSFSHKIDKCTVATIYKILHEICLTLFNRTEIGVWLGDTRVKLKRNDNDKKVIEPIRQNISLLTQNKSLKMFSQTLFLIKDLPEIICYRKELFNDLCKAINTAYFSNTSVYDAMKEIRNIKRRVGRKITGKCIGTTLLTKGLEFDTVVLLNAHKFSDIKNLYVALTRASKNLVVFSENEILNPYNKL